MNEKVGILMIEDSQNLDFEIKIHKNVNFIKNSIKITKKENFRKNLRKIQDLTMKEKMKDEKIRSWCVIYPTA